MKKVLLICLIFFTFPFITFAQESTPSATPQTSQPTSLEQMTQDYFFQLEKYRSAEKQFDLNKAEFQQIGTLVSREKAVTSLKELMVLRAKVLEVYLGAIKLILYEAQGIDVVEKQAILDYIDETVIFLKNHQQAIPPLLDKDEVLAESAVLETNKTMIDEAIYRSLALVAIGRVQRTFDTLVVTTNDFKSTYVEPIPDSSKKDFINRGLNDVNIANEAVRTALQKATDNYQAFFKVDRQGKKESRSGVYSSVVKALQPGVSQMNKANQYLIELERQI